MTNTNYVTAGAKLKEIHKSKQLSSFKVSHAFNVSRKYIKGIERGDYAPSEPVLIALSELYQIDSHALLNLYGITMHDDVKLLMQKPQLKNIMVGCTAKPDLTPILYIEMIEEFKTMNAKYFSN